MILIGKSVCSDGKVFPEKKNSILERCDILKYCWQFSWFLWPHLSHSSACCKKVTPRWSQHPNCSIFAPLNVSTIIFTSGLPIFANYEHVFKNNIYIYIIYYVYIRSVYVYIWLYMYIYCSIYIYIICIYIYNIYIYIMYIYIHNIYTYLIYIYYKIYYMYKLT
jgi:hypothetical protein